MPKTRFDKKPRDPLKELMPVIEEQIKVINHRISDLEDDMKNHHH